MNATTTAGSGDNHTPAILPMALKVGVMGGAAPVMSADHLDRAHRLGRAVAERGCVLVTGACPGLPLAAACGCKHAGGTVVGISPAMDLDEHLGRFRSPVEFHDILIFTGNGLMGREVINIRTSDVVVIIGGRTGTLGELAIAYDEAKPIGVLSWTGGISDLVADILRVCAKETGAQVVYHYDPAELIDSLLKIHRTAKPRPLIEHLDTSGGGPTLVTDPICGMRIVPLAAVAKRSVDGCQYWFCSDDCAKVFDTRHETVAIQSAQAAVPKGDKRNG